MTGFLDKETLQLLQDTAQKAASAHDKLALVAMPTEPYAEVRLVLPDGTAEEAVVNIPPRKHRLGNVAEVARYTALAELTILMTDATVWYNRQSVNVVFNDRHDDDDLRGRATVDLVESPELVELRRFESGEKWLGQKEFVFLCRSKFNRCLENADQFLRTIRSIKFYANESGHGNIQKSRESLGRSIESEVSSEFGEIPDEITLNVKVFTDATLKGTRPIRCAFDVDQQTGKMRLVPLAGEIESAVDAEVETIGEMLGNSVKLPIVCGQP